MYTRSEAGKIGYAKSVASMENQRKLQADASHAKHEQDTAKCRFCDAPLPYKKRANKFCNHSCAAKFSGRNIGSEVPKFCLRCKSPILGLGKVYCSTQCSHRHKTEKFVVRFLSNSSAIGSGSLPAIRRYLIRIRGESCEACGWAVKHTITGNVPLEVDHRDGNHSNNKIENLRIICPNCHSLTPNFRNLNKGHGREYRKKVPG